MLFDNLHDGWFLLMGFRYEMRSIKRGNEQETARHQVTKSMLLIITKIFRIKVLLLGHETEHGEQNQQKQQNS